jgi:hypothetical protein
LGGTVPRDSRGVKDQGRRSGEATTTHTRIQITIQTEQILILRRRGCARRWCAECGLDVEVVDLSQAEALTSKAQPRFEDGSEVKKWHCVESPDGAALVCLQSLLESMGSGPIKTLEIYPGEPK